MCRASATSEAADQTEISLELTTSIRARDRDKAFLVIACSGARGNADTDPVDGVVTFLELKNYVQEGARRPGTPQHPGGNTTAIGANTIPCRSCRALAKTRNSAARL
jgi:hypothetical protein